MCTHLAVFNIERMPISHDVGIPISQDVNSWNRPSKEKCMYKKNVHASRCVWDREDTHITRRWDTHITRRWGTHITRRWDTHITRRWDTNITHSLYLKHGTRIPISHLLTSHSHILGILDEIKRIPISHDINSSKKTLSISTSSPHILSILDEINEILQHEPLCEQHEHMCEHKWETTSAIAHMWAVWAHIRN